MFVSNRVTTCLENVETVHVRELNISHGGVIEKGEVREIQGILYCLENGSKLVVVFFFHKMLQIWRVDSGGSF